MLVFLIMMLPTSFEKLAPKDAPRPLLRMRKSLLEFLVLLSPPKQDSDREVVDDVSDDDDNDEHADVKSRGADEMAQPDPPPRRD